GQELLRRLRRHLLSPFQPGARHWQCLGAEMREFATLGLFDHLRRVGESRLRDTVRGDAEQKRRLWRASQGIGEREKAHRELKVVARLGAVRRFEKGIPSA